MGEEVICSHADRCVKPCGHGIYHEEDNECLNPCQFIPEAKCKAKHKAENKELKNFVLYPLYSPGAYSKESRMWFKAENEEKALEYCIDLLGWKINYTVKYVCGKADQCTSDCCKHKTPHAFSVGCNSQCFKVKPASEKCIVFCHSVIITPHNDDYKNVFLNGDGENRGRALREAIEALGWGIFQV